DDGALDLVEDVVSLRGRGRGAHGGLEGRGRAPAREVEEFLAEGAGALAELGEGRGGEGREGEEERPELAHGEADGAPESLREEDVHAVVVEREPHVLVG